MYGRRLAKPMSKIQHAQVNFRVGSFGVRVFARLRLANQPHMPISFSKNPTCAVIVSVNHRVSIYLENPPCYTRTASIAVGAKFVA
jgi:hypothetical protein